MQWFVSEVFYRKMVAFHPNPYCPLLVFFSVASSNLYQCFLGLDKIVEKCELEAV